ncbi:sensor histidine kinase [Luteibacter aegosomatissinici]|uniref:sensor histidine kinase n=1 Tax=Luteibacter aegosomatissinici TaxID=2911539 RepID=UPI001FF70476|nr:ATP-binding protein [Luteibacter aegosomatissinici]UPG96120.1 ATP-binding protein [Luteibacter aegosomatissinici]
MNLVRTARDWLDRAPTSSPVDRLNARFIQILMIGLGFATLLSRLYFIAIHAPADALGSMTVDQVTDLGSDLAVMAATLGGLIVVRRGHFARGIQLFLSIYLLALMANFATTGYRHAPLDPTPTLLLAVAGVVLGRRTLWVVYSAVLAAFALGQLADALWLAEPRPSLAAAFHVLPMLVIAYLLVAFAIDSTTRALRTMLAEAIERSDALAAANCRLKQEMEERERTQHQLIHSQKLDAIGRAASGVAHDVDNVLSVILGYAAQREQLADLGTNALLTAMEGMELAALRALSISRKLLNFSREDIIDNQVFDAGDALRELEPLLRQLLGRYIQPVLRLPDAPMPVQLDRSAFELMVLNIAANARDAMPDGGRFTMSLDAPRHGSTVTLALADTGVGMSDDVCAKVFEPFYTTKPYGHGTGIGLSVVAAMVRAAQGSIDVCSAPGEGSQFLISLPVHDENACAAPQVSITNR